eukprot:CAMPEP_0172522084 /NCGR_PEP_ID=MMETSP1066-20121228/292932_1 /TAXON_ID=671091 /ORGANISM="Coscinodiscus wailesii, Strain CCMP2513" /LENGTH=636 /DNA_ID=CAMNT_0013305055 /DNA_START=455 /DNA_END=2365 /DNA_ORIENTATION=-
MTLPHRRIYVITTASLPWRTGTAVNPLLRALYLTRYVHPTSRVTLVVPWLTNEEDRRKLYGGSNCFETADAQEEWVRHYAAESCGCEAESDVMDVLWYPAVYKSNFGSIFPTVDICTLIPAAEADVAVLEEPEHLNWLKVHSNLSSEDYWTSRFKHVVGVVHTNYEHYAKQAGFAVAAPAIGVVSTLVIRAYCHRVIKLSGVLPSFAPGKEVVCNVHGVRSEFLEIPAPTSKSASAKSPSSNDSDENSIYFIGKLVWAKGFDIMLNVQEKFRKDTGDYFPIDIYGGGPDEIAIGRAFHGRPQLIKGKTVGVEDEQHKHLQALPEANTESEAETNGKYDPKFDYSRSSSVFLNPLSLREQSLELSQKPSNDSDTSSDHIETVVKENDNSRNPLSILCDFRDRSVDTSISTSKAVYNIADKTIQAGLAMTFSFHNNEDNSMTFDPPQSRYELRRHPVPATFKGVKDHALLTSTKIFLNPSLSEVLCTTTAEALAMNKFVIIPHHASNEFFFQFPNALVYTSVADCVAKLQYAIANDPPTLPPNLKKLLSWEAATERFITSSIVARGEERIRMEKGEMKTDQRIAWIHSKTKFWGGGDHQVKRGRRDESDKKGEEKKGEDSYHDDDDDDDDMPPRGCSL